jgi:hypothetical protein
MAARSSRATKAYCVEPDIRLAAADNTCAFFVRLADLPDEAPGLTAAAIFERINNKVRVKSEHPAQAARAEYVRAHSIELLQEALDLGLVYEVSMQEEHKATAPSIKVEKKEQL